MIAAYKRLLVKKLIDLIFTKSLLRSIVILVCCAINNVIVQETMFARYVALTKVICLNFELAVYE